MAGPALRFKHGFIDGQLAPRIAAEHVQNSIEAVCEAMTADERCGGNGTSIILQNLSPAEVSRLEPYLDTISYEPGDCIIREGDPADRLYMLASGNATVDVVLDDGKRRTRLAAFRPGVSFGEFALFDGGRRVANVIAETPGICYVLNFQKLEQLGVTEPDLYQRMMFALGRLLTDRLRRVTAEVRALT